MNKGINIIMTTNKCYQKMKQGKQLKRDDEEDTIALGVRKSSLRRYLNKHLSYIKYQAMQ